MTTHRFSVNAPNPGDKAIQTELRLDRAKPTHLAWLGRSTDRTVLKVKHAGITRDPCGNEGTKTLRVRLAPRSSIEVHVVVETDGAPQQGAVGFHLVDRRGSKDVGGVLLICVSPALVEPAGQTIQVLNPCLASLARAPYLILAGDDPSTVPTKAFPPEAALELVAPIANPTSAPLSVTTAYLEHLGASAVTFTPGTWNIGTLDRKSTFFATWRVDPGAALTSFTPTIVVGSQQKDPVRLSAAVLRKNGGRQSTRKA